MKKQIINYLFLIILISVLVIPSLALAAWWNPFTWNWNILSWFKTPSQTQMQTQKQPVPQIVGNDRDAHGCIGSAGYSWCGTKQKCLRPWEESCEISSDAYPLFANLKWSNSSRQKIQNINGYQITATDNINSDSDARKFFNYYDSKLKALGWTSDNDFAADGILGSQVGYEKDNNYIVLNYTIKPGKVTSGANEPLQWTCPCAVTYSIFTGSKPK